MIQNYKLTLAYDGSRYYGWERQPDKDTIQGRLENVLGRLSGEEGNVIGAGRTDAGVHARGMTASVRLESDLSERELMDYMNRYLPDDIAVRDIRIASDRFHARYKAVGKLYRYTCYDGRIKPVFERKYVNVLEDRLDIERMRKAASFLVGKHDYKSFCGNPRMKKSTVRIVDRIEISRRGSFVYLYYHGTGFLQYMVRIMSGTLIEVGQGKREPEDLERILDAMDRSQAGPAAPARGLCLISVDY